MAFFDKLKNKNEYYYDFGTGNKMKREDSNKKDDFLEGFNSVTDTPVAKTLRYEPKEEAKPKPVSYSSNTSYRAPQLNNTQGYTPSTAHLGGDIKTDEDKNLFYNAFEAENRVQQNKPQKSQNPDAIEVGEDSETYKILQDLGNRWYQTDSQQEKDRLHGVAEEVRRLSRGDNPLKYGTDEIFDVMHKNAKTGQLVKGVSLGTIPIKSALTNPLLAGVSGSLLEPSAFLTAMALDKNQWNYKYQDEWRVGGVDEKGNKLKYYDGKDLDADNHRNWLPWIYFDGYLIGADKFGNMNMAYVGKKMGLPEWVYKNFTTMDDPEDIFWIDKGTSYAESGR